MLIRRTIFLDTLFYTAQYLTFGNCCPLGESTFTLKHRFLPTDPSYRRMIE
jgi:hypothetical protein